MISTVYLCAIAYLLSCLFIWMTALSLNCLVEPKEFNQLPLLYSIIFLYPSSRPFKRGISVFNTHYHFLYPSLSKSSHIWQLRLDQDYWCAGAYLINKQVMKPYIDNILFSLQNGWTGAAISAGTFFFNISFHVGSTYTWFILYLFYSNIE